MYISNDNCLLLLPHFSQQLSLFPSIHPLPPSLSLSSTHTHTVMVALCQFVVDLLSMSACLRVCAGVGEPERTFGFILSHHQTTLTIDQLTQAIAMMDGSKGLSPILGDDKNELSKWHRRPTCTHAHEQNWSLAWLTWQQRWYDKLGSALSVNSSPWCLCFWGCGDRS